jgi:sulfonate transport system permease protein
MVTTETALREERPFEPTTVEVVIPSGRNAARRHVRSAAPPVAILLILGGIWQLFASLEVFGATTLPGPTEIVRQMIVDRSLLALNTGTTLTEVGPALLAAVIAGIAFGLLFVEVRATEELLSGPFIALLCAPPIALAPIFYVTFSPYAEKVTLAALAAFFPVLVATIAGASAIEPSLVDVVRASGGGSLSVVRKVVLPAALPSVASGVQIAAPAAVLGAILGEFAGGTSGLGVFMLNSIAEFNPARTWGAGAIATALGAVSYLVLGAARKALFKNAPLPLRGRRYTGTTKPSSRRVRIGRAALSVVVSLVVWWAAIRAFGLPEYFAKTPTDVFRFFFVSDGSGGAQRASVLAALGQTMPGAMLGALIGLAAAFLGAIALLASRVAQATLMPIAMVLQSVPLQALAPLIVVVLGRGLFSTVTVAVLVTFFPAVVLIAFGMRAVPPTAIDVFKAMNAPERTIMLKLRLPAALPQVLAAARIGFPSALMGVLVAEYLASGSGIGYLLANARQDSEYGTVWAATILITIVSVLLYAVVGWFDRWALTRFTEADR